MIDLIKLKNDLRWTDLIDAFYYIPKEDDELK